MQILTDSALRIPFFPADSLLLIIARANLIICMENHDLKNFKSLK